MIIPSPVIAMMEMAFNRALRMDPDANAAFMAMQGRVIGIQLQGLDVNFFLAPQADGVQLLSDYEEDADAILSGKPFSMLHTAMSHDRSRLFDGDVQVRGDVELGQKVQHILHNLDIDWEEQLSHVVGDVAAHQIGRAVRGAGEFFSYALRHVLQDSAEYFTEEKRDLPSMAELEIYCSDVDNIRADVERMEQRVLRLRRCLEGEQS